MKTTELIGVLNALKAVDGQIAVKLAIAMSIDDNIDLTPYDNEGVDEIGDRILAFLLQRSDWPDIDELCYRIQNLINDGEYESITDECILDAFNQIDQ